MPNIFLHLRVRVAMEPKCTLTADSCDNNKISTFCLIFIGYSGFKAIFPVITIIITRINIFEGDG